jgi:lipid-binding SYLF domain-containing protein
MREESIVESSSQVLREVMAIPASGIPRSLLSDAQGIAIVPRLLKGGFVVGVRHGRGVVVVRDEERGWKAPVFITITGGSLGWQAGVQAADIVLVFKSRTSVESLMQGKFTIGGNVSAAAGPVGRQAEAATDAQLRAEIYSYSRARGLFAGAAVDGSVMQVDATANAAYYGSSSAGQASPMPASAVKLLEEVSKYTGVPPATEQLNQLPGKPTAAEGQALQGQLADAAIRLNQLLDEKWQKHLALPAEVFAPNRPVDVAALKQALDRFDRVAANPQYQALAQKTEFQQTHALLKQWIAQLAPAAAPLALPPPPADGR